MSVWIEDPVCVRSTCWAPAPTNNHSQDQTVPIQLLMAVIIFKELTPFLAGNRMGFSVQGAVSLEGILSPASAPRLACSCENLPLPWWMDGHSTRPVSDDWHSQGPEGRGHLYDWQLEKPYS